MGKREAASKAAQRLAVQTRDLRLIKCKEWLRFCFEIKISKYLYLFALTGFVASGDTRAEGNISPLVIFHHRETLTIEAAANLIGCKNIETINPKKPPNSKA